MASHSVQGLTILAISATAATAAGCTGGPALVSSVPIVGIQQTGSNGIVILNPWLPSQTWGVA